MIHIEDLLINRLPSARTDEIIHLKSFLSNLSHELRTPLNAIVNLTDSISKETLNKKIKQDCKIIKYSSSSLLGTLNNMLDYYKIEKGELVLEEVTFSPHKILNHIKKNAFIQAKYKNLDFEYNKTDCLSFLCIGDAARLKQILNIVLHNAIKFTLKGKVKFQIDVKQKKEAKITLTFIISDTGVGISKEKIVDIYDSFSRNAIDSKVQFGGLGLGLYIAKTLVDMQNGTIHIDSELDIGTTCTISLDFMIVPTPNHKVIAQNQVYDLKGKHILAIDDNAMNQMVIQMITKKWLNTTVSYASNGQEGLDALKEKKIDVILMDLQMPIMDGYETTIAIRNGTVGLANSGIPIIAVTADVSESTKQRVKEIGIDHFLSKPLKDSILYRAIEGLV